MDLDLFYYNLLSPNQQKIYVHLLTHFLEKRGLPYDKESLERISPLMDLYLQDEYGDALHKPNYYFVDSIEALKSKKVFMVREQFFRL